jgi:hypothetical protein
MEPYLQQSNKNIEKHDCFTAMITQTWSPWEQGTLLAMLKNLDELHTDWYLAKSAGQRHESQNGHRLAHSRSSRYAAKRRNSHFLLHIRKKLDRPSLQAIRIKRLCACVSIQIGFQPNAE